MVYSGDHCIVWVIVWVYKSCLYIEILLCTVCIITIFKSVLSSCQDYQFWVVSEKRQPVTLQIYHNTPITTTDIEVREIFTFTVLDSRNSEPLYVYSNAPKMKGDLKFGVWGLRDSSIERKLFTS